MTTLVHHVSTPVSGVDTHDLSECVLRDIKAFLKRRSSVVHIIDRKYWERFYVLDSRVPRPSEFNKPELHYFKPSAAHLPATDDSLSKMTHVFESYTDLALARKFQFTELKVQPCNLDDIIIYTIKPLA